MRRKEADFATPAAQQTARHLATLIRQARLVRNWSQAELAERSRASLATIKRIERGALETSLGAWMAALELVGVLPRLNELRDPASEALLNDTRAKRPRRARLAADDLDF